MTKKMIADVQITNDVTINDNPVILSVNGVNANISGNVDIELYSTEEVDKMVAMLPVTRVGTMDYLPLNINGSFEGASNYIGKGVYPVVLENDGTLVYLRPGTNGSTYGYYFCYVKGARTSSNLQPVLTNENFKPSFFTPNHKLISFISSNAAELLMMRTNDGSVDTYTLSLTNATMNPVSHQSVEFPRTTIVGTDPQYAIISNDIIYILCLDGYSNTSEMAISIYTISVSDVVAGIYSSLVKISGFSGLNLFGDVISSSTNIKLAPRYFSNTPSDNSFFCVPSGNTYTSFATFLGNNEGTLHAETLGTNIRISFLLRSVAYTIQKNQIEFSVISLSLNTSTKSYSIDNTVKGQSTMTTDANGNITWLNPYSQNTVDYYGVPKNTLNNKVPTFTTTADGVQFAVMARHDSDFNHYISRCSFTNFTSKYAAWNFNTHTTNSMFLSTIAPIYGSAIGDNLINPTIISPSKILLRCGGTSSSGVTFGYDSTVYTLLGSSPNYVYDSISSGSTINGFEPAYRENVTKVNYEYNGCISIINQDGSTEVYGSSFIEGVPTKYSGLVMNESDLTYAQQITIGGSVLSDLKSSILSAVTLPYTVTNSRIVLYYVPNNTYTKSIAMTTVLVGAPSGVSNLYFIVSEVDVTFISNQVSNAISTNNIVVSTNLIRIGINTSLLYRQTGLIIAKYAEFTYVGIPSLVSLNTSGASTNYSIICKVDNTTKSIYGTPKLITSSYSSFTTNTFEVGVIPNIGFGLFENGNVTDNKTKLIFKNFGTTEAQFDSMIANPLSSPIERIVVAAQDVPEGFTVYFTQEIPVLLSGKFFKLPPQSINLQDLFGTVVNKTFYIYVSIIGTIPEYQITDVLQTEELFRTYIGTITTDLSGITSIVSEKVTRFLTYRTSTTKRGSAIPTSTGIPSGTGTRWS